MSNQDHGPPVRGNTRRELRAEFLEAETPVIGMEMRLAAACEAGGGTDARLVLLTMHAGLIHPNVVERHQLTME